MATDFYDRQDAARRSTSWLIGMFAIGVIAVVGGVMLVAWIVTGGMESYRAAQGGEIYDAPDAFTHVTRDDWLAILAAGGATLLLIGGGSTFKVAQLAGGGSVVAEELGGKRVYPNTTDFVEKRLLNVVEEMALASGVPVPPVYLLDAEKGINAFAAGYSPSDAVVAVTRGTAEQLSREELQGVVAHEFSHILNGDMRLNIRLIGILHGLLLLGLIGRIMLRLGGGSGRSRSSRNNSGAAIVMIGLALFVLGYVGTLIGSLIKAAVSRQREYLADASAVQFTRNPGGLAGALKKIGAYVAGSRLKAPKAAEASHMFFSQGVWEGFTGLTATHPPLESRIRALEPNWDGTYPPMPKQPAGVAEIAAVGVSGLAGAATADSGVVPIEVVSHAADQVGEPEESHREYVTRLVQSIPPVIVENAHDPYGARAVLYGLLLDADPEVRERQLAELAQRAAPDVYQLTLDLLPYLDLLDVRVRLPLVDMAMPALRAMSPSQYRTFNDCFRELVRADDRLGLFEWMLYRVLTRHLRPQFEKTAAARVAYYGLQKLEVECSVLLSTLAYADNRREAAAAAVIRGATRLAGVKVTLLPPESCGLDPLRDALKTLSQVVPKQRRTLVEACAATICADAEVTVAEAELLRGICDMLECPMPPLLPGQRVAAS